MAAAPRTLVFVPRPACWPWLEKRLRHAAELGYRHPLNEEAIAIGYLYQHASTARRRQLYEFLRVNDCECLGCQLKTRSLAEILRGVPLALLYQALDQVLAERLLDPESLRLAQTLYDQLEESAE